MTVWRAFDAFEGQLQNQYRYLIWSKMVVLCSMIATLSVMYKSDMMRPRLKCSTQWKRRLSAKRNRRGIWKLSSPMSIVVGEKNVKTLTDSEKNKRN
jgi:hypothetical protein